MKRILILLVFAYSCSTSNDAITIDEDVINTEDPVVIWDVPTENLKEGAPYTLVNDPKFKNVGILDLEDNEEVIVIKGEEGIKVYPLRYVNFSEVVNDEIDDIPIAITNCPQTKSSICFVRISKDPSFDLKASGYLYNDNQVYSNADESIFWSQMLLQKIRGDNKYKKTITYPSIKTVWKTIKDFYPNAQVYYRAQSKLLPTTTKRKKTDNLVLGVIDDSKFETQLYLFKKDTGNKQVSLQNSQVLIYTNTTYSFTTTLKLPTIEVTLTDNFPDIIIDQANNTWDAFGFCTAGNRLGERLDSLTFYEAEEWAWQLFFENINYEE